jgi:hypothetical protein
MKGYRKMVGALFIVLFATILIVFDRFNDTTANFLIWLYGIFAGSNVAEHFAEKNN